MWRRAGMTLLTLLLPGIFAAAAAGAPQHETLAQADQRCFPQTNFCIAGRIREFWEQNGGLSVFGYPTGQQQEELIEGRPFQVQWFERNRLELHPENAWPFDVLLGRLGADRLSQQGRDWMQFPASASQPGCRFFPKTGHNACGAILASWRANGLESDRRSGYSEAENLALYGLPLSDERVEVIEGKEYTVQWFERARFELHPENAPPYNILLGLLGNEIRQAAAAAPTLAPSATPMPTNTPKPTSKPRPTRTATPTPPDDLACCDLPPSLVADAGGYFLSAPPCMSDGQSIELAAHTAFCVEDPNYNHQQDAQITVRGPDGQVVEQVVLRGSPSVPSRGSWFWFGRQGYTLGTYTLTAQQNTVTFVRSIQLQAATRQHLAVGLPVGTPTHGMFDLMRDIPPGTTVHVALAGFPPSSSVPLYVYSRAACATHPPLTPTPTGGGQSSMCFVAKLPRDTPGVAIDARGEGTYQLHTRTTSPLGEYCVTTSNDGICPLSGAFILSS